MQPKESHMELVEIWSFSLSKDQVELLFRPSARPGFYFRRASEISCELFKTSGWFRSLIVCCSLTPFLVRIWIFRVIKTSFETRVSLSLCIVAFFQWTNRTPFQTADRPTRLFGWPVNYKTTFFAQAESEHAGTRWLNAGQKLTEGFGH